MIGLGRGRGRAQGRRARWATKRAGNRLGVEQLETRELLSFFGNSLFPADSAWNQKITNAPVSGNSTAIINHIINRAGTGNDPHLHPDFGNPITDNALYGIPINVVSAGQPTINVIIDPGSGYPGESDIVPVPIPANAVIEGDLPGGPAPTSQRGDSHLIVYDKSANKLYELYLVVRPTETTWPAYGDPNPPAHTTGQWGAYQESVWDLNTNTFRTVGFTSADAAGLPILPGLVRADEALPAAQGGQGVITHALRMTVNDTLNQFIYPASHEASNKTASDLPRMGERFRLKASFVIPASWTPEAKAIAQAMKDYGLIVADNGSDMYVTGEPSNLWNDNNLILLKQIRTSDFEVVDLTPHVASLSVATGATGGGTSVVISGQNFSGAAGNLHILFGTTPASSFVITSDSQITAFTPAHAAGTVHVTVQSGSNKIDSNNQSVFFGYGTSATSTADQFTYVIPGGTLATTTVVTSHPSIAFSATSQNVTLSAQVNSSGGTVNVGTVSFLVNGLGTTSATNVASNGSASAVFTIPGGTAAGSYTITASYSGGGNFAGSASANQAAVTIAAPAPPPPPPPGHKHALYVTGADAGGEPLVNVYDDSHTLVKFSFDAYPPTFRGGVRVAVGDVDGDGIEDIVTAAGPGGGPHIKVFSGKDLSVLASFMAYDPGFAGGVFVAVGNFDADARAEIVTGAGLTGGSHVRIFKIANGSASILPGPLGSFFAYDPGFHGGVEVAAGNYDGIPGEELITGVGPGGGPHVKVFRADGAILASFFAYDPGFSFGINVAAADINGDGKAEIITGSGANGGPHVKVYNGGNGAQLFSFFAYDPGFLGGVRVAGIDRHGPDGGQILVAPGPNGGPRVRVLDGASLATLDDFFAYDPSFGGGVFVGGKRG